MTSPSRLSVTWPARFRPEVAHLVSRAEMQIPASPEAVWARLVRAEQWAAWYSGASEVTFELWDGPDLRAGTMFEWTTFDVRLRSVVNEFDPVSRIGWYSRAEGVEAWHAWVLEPTDDGGTLVVTEESLLGLVARFAVGLDEAITQQHVVWLQGLAAGTADVVTR